MIAVTSFLMVKNENKFVQPVAQIVEALYNIPIQLTECYKQLLLCT